MLSAKTLKVGLITLWAISHALANALVIVALMKAERPFSDGYSMLLYLNTIPLSFTYGTMKTVVKHQAGLPDDLRDRRYALVFVLPVVTGLMPAGIWARLILP